MNVNIEFRGVDEFAAVLKKQSAQVQQETALAMRDIATEWQREAKQRIPVDTGTTRNTVLSEHGRKPNGDFYAAVGSNQRHARFIEFGTKWIAGGAVKALGTDPNITDADAVTTWPALEERGGSRQQMPWLRPAFMAIRDRIIKRLQKVLRFK
jgi:HK97 gp10 family phage protein